MTAQEQSIQQRTDRFHADGIVDFHFDLLIDLYEKRDRPGALVSHFLPEFETGGIGVLGVAIYIEDRYMPEMGLRVALDQVARLYAAAVRDLQNVCRDRASSRREQNRAGHYYGRRGAVRRRFEFAPRVLRARRAVGWLDACAPQRRRQRRDFQAERFATRRPNEFRPRCRAGM